MKKANIQRTVSLLIVSSMLLCVPTIESQAAVITSNATDKLAVIFDENTAYCAGDYVTYDGELYLCASDVQGIWDAAKASFIQITKNHALGEVSELSAEYESQKDPSEETSLMSFVANAWQKLKTFLGIGDHAAQTDKEHYKEAPVSAKLNYLETQNEDLEEHITNLQGKVNDSFQSVSNVYFRNQLFINVCECFCFCFTSRLHQILEKSIAKIYIDCTTNHIYNICIINFWRNEWKKTKFWISNQKKKILSQKALQWSCCAI